MPTSSELQAIRSELDTVKAQNRRLRWIVSVGVILTCGLASAASVGTTGSARASFDEVEAKAFLLVDQNDEIRARLRMLENDPSLELLGPRGKRRILIVAGRDDSSLMFFQGETCFVQLTATKDPAKRDHTQLALGAWAGSRQVILECDRTTSSARLAGPQKSAIALEMDSHGGGRIVSYDENGNPSIVADRKSK